MYNLSICAVVRNEARYLLEWVFFHQLQGVERFYFYEGGSTDNTLPILHSLEKLGIATVHSSPKYHISRQMECYDAYLKEHKRESLWTAFIDVDEFLFSPIGQLLPIIYSCASSALAVHWMIYGSNGEKCYDPGNLVIDRFTKREAKVGTHIKSICYTDETIKASGNPHAFILEDCAENERHERLKEEYAILEGGSADKIRINHYHVKSSEEYFGRKYDQVAAMGFQDTLKEHNRRFEGHDKNEVEDPVLTQYSSAVKSLIHQFTYR